MTIQSHRCLACGGYLKKWFRRRAYHYLRCNSCHSCMTDPIPSGTKIVAYYRRKFRTGNYLWLRRFAVQYRRIYRQFADVIIAREAEAGRFIRREKILDIGCFTGEFLELMRAEGAVVYGTELQPEAVKIAAEKFPGHIFEADIGTKHFPEIKFEIVACLGLIEHVTQPQQLLESTARILKPGGLLILQTPDAGCRLARCLGRWWPPLAPVEHIHIFSGLGLKLLLASHGFTDIRIEPHIKYLPVAYVYRQFSTFGHHFGRILQPIGWLLSSLPASVAFPFYGGEVIVTARKKLT